MIETMTEKMILIPAGPFPMGSSDADVLAVNNERPQHVVYLPDFYIAVTPVTNVEYARFVEATGHISPPRHYREDGRVPKGLEQHPVVNVTWYDALAYCRWLTERLRKSGDIGPDKEVTLPTEAEWEKAARGDDGRIYPWGDEWDAFKANTYESGPRDMTPVGSYPAGASPYGVLDMSGNVWEWCRTKWRDSYEEPTDESLEGDALRVVRGGAWYSRQRNARCAARARVNPYYIRVGSGFRVVVAPDASGL